MIIGLTGGIASGKSTVSEILKELKFEICDADKIAHDVLNTEKAKKEIFEKLGKSFLGNNGEILRKSLREEVFNNQEKLKILNSIIHPKVIEEFEAIKNITPKERTVIFDIPLLFEVNLEYLCDKIILVHTDRENQIKRIVKRDGSTREMAEKIIDSQMKLEEKIKKSHYILENSGSIEELRDKTLKIVEFIRGETV